MCLFISFDFLIYTGLTLVVKISSHMEISCISRQYRAWGWPGDIRSQIIMRYDTDLVCWIKCVDMYHLVLPISYHRGEAMDISVIDFQWYCTKRNGFKYFNHSSFDYHYMHQLWNYIYYMHISSKIYQYCSTLNLYNLCYRSIRHYNADYSGLEWSNINTIWPRCG